MRVNAWYGGSILANKTFHKSPFNSVKMVACYYIINSTRDYIMV
jgi:hypothetical protein